MAMSGAGAWRVYGGQSGRGGHALRWTEKCVKGGSHRVDTEHKWTKLRSSRGGVKGMRLRHITFPESEFPGVGNFRATKNKRHNFAAFQTLRRQRDGQSSACPSTAAVNRFADVAKNTHAFYGNPVGSEPMSRQKHFFNKQAQSHQARLVPASYSFG